jgi:nucleoid-associated protein YgaU
MSSLVYENGGLHLYVDSEGGRKPKDTVAPTQPPKATSPSASNVKESDSQSKAEKAFKEREFVVEGNATVIADPEFISNATINMAGLGKVMSGNYYVERVVHTWSREGYTQELELRSNTAGGMKPTPIQPPAKQTTRKEKPQTKAVPAPQKTHIVKKGETLWSIASKYYGNGSQWTKIWNANKTGMIARDKRNEQNPGHWLHIGYSLLIP